MKSSANIGLLDGDLIMAENAQMRSNMESGEGVNEQ